MPAKFNLYTAWMDPYFYVLAAVLAAALFAMVYSIRRYLELKNASDFEDSGQAEAENPLDEAERAELAKQAEEVRPKLIIAGGSAYPRQIDFRRFREIADEVGALFLVGAGVSLLTGRSLVFSGARQVGIERVLAPLGITGTSMRRGVRSRLRPGNAVHTERVVHRSDDCKRFFRRARELSEENGEVAVRHLFAAVLEDPGPVVSAVLAGAGIWPETSPIPLQH